jgi:cytochrome d ubiquinol oxidase subunit II
MLFAVLLFLGVALLFWVLLAGADFGAGILELFPGGGRRDEQRELVSHAMAPVWEANHVWLILAVVILFVAFPGVYTTMSVVLFVPVVALLVGIVGRGTAFTFRHYDPPPTGAPGLLGADWRPLYSRVFAASSLWSSAWIGVLAGAMVLGRVDPAATDATGLYLRPWANSFCLAMAVFTAAAFAVLAAVYLVGEASDDEMATIFRRKARAAAVVMVAAGGAVFVCSELLGFRLARAFFGNPISLTCFAVATMLLVPFARALAGRGSTTTPLRAGEPPPAHSSPPPPGGGRTLLTRVLGAVIVTLVLVGGAAVQYPVAIRLAHGALTFPDAVAPPVTLEALLVALVAGSCLIFPALAYLFRVFKWETFERERMP